MVPEQVLNQIDRRGTARSSAFWFSLGYPSYRGQSHYCQESVKSSVPSIVTSSIIIQRCALCFEVPPLFAKVVSNEKPPFWSRTALNEVCAFT
jgi:hypothetical protein